MVQLIDQGKISGKIAKSVFEAMLDRTNRRSKSSAKKAWSKFRIWAASRRLSIRCSRPIPNKSININRGNEKVFGFFVGQIMKATQGKANPQKVNEILREKLRS